MKRVAAAAALATASLASAQPAPTMRELFVVREFPAFKVMVPQEKSLWCGSTANVTIVGQSGDQFAENAPVIQRIVGGLRAIISFECPDASRIQLSGTVEGRPLYQAYAAASDNWVLQGIELRTSEQLQMLAALETVNRCDELGGSPDDPESLSAGIPDDALNGPEVIEFCQKAVAIDGESPRFKFQLARGLLTQGREEEALEYLVPAAEAGHGGALALLGDFYLAGAAGIEADPATAKALYEQAVTARYEPARAALAGFEDQTEALAGAEAEERRAVAAAPAQRPATVASSQPRAGVLNPQGYEFPAILQAIYSGDADHLPERTVKIYLVNQADVFRNVCRAFTINEMNDLKMAVVDQSDFTAAAGGYGLMDALTNLATMMSDPAAMRQAAQNAQANETFPQQAAEDAMLFIERNNCDSPAFERYAVNLRAFVKDQSVAANLAAPGFSQACNASANPSYGTTRDFCVCFIARANGASLSRADKRALLNNFWPTATRLMNGDSGRYGVCNGSLAR